MPVRCTALRTILPTLAATAGPLACIGPTIPASVVALKSARGAISPPRTARVYHLARGRNAYVGRLELDAGARVPVHRDATEEFVHILEGGGRMTIDGTTHEVRAGMTVYMPANAEVSFDNGPAKTVALQIFAGPAPAQKYDGWSPLR